jgi:hypothetical protein
VPGNRPSVLCCCPHLRAIPLPVCPVECLRMFVGESLQQRLLRSGISCIWLRYVSFHTSHASELCKLMFRSQSHQLPTVSYHKGKESLKKYLIATNTTREPKFPECHKLPRVPKTRHSGKTIFPECCIRGRIALGEELLPRVLKRPRHSGKKHTRGRPSSPRATLGEDAHTGKKVNLTATLDGSVCQKNGKRLPWVPCSRHSGKVTSSPSAFSQALGDFFIFCFFCPVFFDAFPRYLKLIDQIWLTFEYFIIFC